ncbi:MAG TPA: ABC transporter substrate-binding protein [Ferrovibrio sp.]|jgi:branched-chain amino acid transport system substrate-binding protein|uniref:ABC transporter substrate-binding protein n=1 Tax=Ferrovibrio sp. TaxID=1917215 RepID=UPI002616FF3C|nr:ABC transporter substrate-binding protein [Ferrovibrio sp.]HLT77079.1 ABC transporter substrate-binding protein [Ferrovibrio sp.]
MNRIALNLLGAAALAVTTGSAMAQDKVIKIGLAQDFTAVYTFVTSDYNQGQRDYFTLINERGGIKGHKIQAEVVDTANQPQRGIEAYERMKNEGAVLVDFLSTPVSRAVVPRALKDQVNMLTLFHGRSDAADGETFPYIFPMTPLYWSQATNILQYIKEQEKGNLKGKKIALVGIDSPFGREPQPIFQALAEKEGYELGIYPYPSPGNEQSATWTAVRRFQPDWTVIWGAGGGQTVSLREAIRNGIKLDRLLSVIWLSEVDTEIAGKEASKGVLRFEGAAYGKDAAVIKAIETEVVAKGKGAGPAAKVGSTYYNIGVAGAALVAEGIRLALEKNPNGPLTGAQLKAGLESIKDFDAQGLIPPVTITAKDHQGGGKGRISQWDGSKWVPKTDWYAASQDLVWELVRKNAEEFKTSGK